MTSAFSVKRSVACASLSVLVAIACGGDFRSTGVGSDAGSDGGRGTGGHGNPDASTGGTTSAGGGDSSGGRGGHAGSGSGGTENGGTSATGGDVGDGGASAGGTDGNGGHASGGKGGTRNTGGTVSSGGTGTGGVTTTGGKTGSGGAGGADSQRAKDYDQTCQYDSDCTLVGESSDVCTFCGCPNAAINKTALDQWDKDRSAFNCPPIACPAIACLQVLASCAKGMCIARKPLVVEAKNYDQSCLDNSGCTTLPLGEVCNGCHCSQGAVSTKGYAQYVKDKASVECTPPPVACKCLPTGTPTCDLTGILTNGMATCTLGSGGAATTTPASN
jgi:hypothetical protein